MSTEANVSKIMKHQRVFAWASEHSGGCRYYRIDQPLAAVAHASGWDVYSDSILPLDGEVPAHLMKRTSHAPGHWSDYDVIIGQRIHQPGPSKGWQTICKSNNVRTIYEWDDDLLHLPAWNPISSQLNQSDFDHIATNISSADAVICTTEPLADISRKFNDNVYVIPNYVDETIINIVRTEVLSAREHKHAHDDSVLLGWQGSPTHKRDFQRIESSLRRLLMRQQRASFACMGANYTRNVQGAIQNPRTSKRIQHINWVENDWKRYYSTVAQFDVGLAPLTSHIFNESKSWIKALEYAALGIPCVASAERPYQDFIQHEKTGFIAHNDSEWFNYMQELVMNDTLRHHISTLAIEHASHHTIQRNVHTWIHALNG